MNSSIVTSALSNAASAAALSPCLPREDVVVVLARPVGALILSLQILADHRRVGRHRLNGSTLTGSAS